MKKKTVAALVGVPALAGGLILAVPGVSGAWSTSIQPRASTSTDCVPSDATGIPATLEITGTSDMDYSAGATYGSTPTATTVTPASGTVSSLSSKTETVSYVFPVSDAGQSVTLTATVNDWPGDTTTYNYSSNTMLAAACAPPTTTTTVPPATTTTTAPTLTVPTTPKPSPAPAPTPVPVVAPTPATPPATPTLTPISSEIQSVGTGAVTNGNG